MNKTIKLAAVSALLIGAANAQDFHVAKNGADTNNGSAAQPFLTIQAAVNKAGAGDKVIVHEGEYREQVTIKQGGKSDNERLILKAADGEKVVVKGSEQVTGWKKKKGQWTLKIKDTYFGDLNPFKVKIKYPKYVSVDDQYEGTGWQTYGLEMSRGNVFLNNQPLKQVLTKEELSEANTWFVDDSKKKRTTIIANFGESDPNKELVEITTREKLVHAEKQDTDYVTIDGLNLFHAATHWAPPTEYQPGAIEPFGSSYWVIENNDIRHSRAVCISIGIPVNGGSTTANGKGRHIIRNNNIQGCGQAAIAGQYYGDYTQIRNNTILDINKHKEFGGWETAGIKVHHNDYSVIENNLIKGVYTFDPFAGAAHGIWIDYQNTNTVIRNNIIMEVEAYPICLEANWAGPFLVANNIIIGDGWEPIATQSSVDGIWVNNIIVDARPSWETQQYGGRPQFRGDRWFNNIYIGDTGMDQVHPNGLDFKLGNNLYLDGATPFKDEKDATVSKTASNFKVTVNEGVAKVSITIGKDGLSNAGKPVVRSFHGKFLRPSAESKEDIPVDTDMVGAKRDKTPMWGPFENLKVGKNEFEIKIR